MRVRVPYILFRTKTGEYGLDAYFSLNVEKVERRATLIRKAEVVKPVPEKPPTAVLRGEDLEEYLFGLFSRLYELSGERMKERTNHMRRWNLLRLIGIPSGHQRHIEREEGLARENREALLALAIMRKVLGVKRPSEIEKARLEFLGYGVFELEVNGREVSDPVYRELFKVDPIAGIALSWLKIKGEKD
ncbi:hypothetical protein [Thermococcus stetteri]|uniref:hypothetical protein n=1 Tax=Thermococcus stetteri TaxID=49900 RepID=UPI001AE5FA42|nr:hypothetical protein [Thermococcus stetteri]MBP1911165.1 hypothetical protein [Thermococcus stetteri]